MAEACARNFLLSPVFYRSQMQTECPSADSPDAHMARGVMELLEELHDGGATIVMVTHDPELAARAQRQVHIMDGQLLELLPRVEKPLYPHSAAAAPRLSG
jgi:predicted ABC-type transport system involved in lysophospholipase L1 biosynthesis ATPase subunit